MVYVNLLQIDIRMYAGFYRGYTMQMKLLDGKKCAEHLVADIALKVQTYCASGLRKPHMTVILVGDHAPSES